jgi:AcrR family transcriptional regulator
MSNAPQRVPGAKRRPPARTGRRPGETATQDAILAAARAEFAQRSYDRATIRGIAAAAGVDPALVPYFFGSKQQLFRASIELAVNAEEAVPALLAGGPSGLGERLVRFYLGLWEDEGTREAVIGMVRSAVAHEEAAELLRGFLARAVFDPFAAALGGEDARLRVELAGAHLLGLGVARYIVRVEPLASTELEVVVERAAPSIQRYFDVDRKPGGSR